MKIHAVKGIAPGMAAAAALGSGLMLSTFSAPAHAAVEQKSAAASGTSAAAVQPQSVCDGKVCLTVSWAPGDATYTATGKGSGYIGYVSVDGPNLWKESLIGVNPSVTGTATFSPGTVCATAQQTDGLIVGEACTSLP